MYSDEIVRERQELVADIERHLSEWELRFARGKDGRVNYRYALEVAIDLMERQAANLKRNQLQPSIAH